MNLHRRWLSLGFALLLAGCAGLGTSTSATSSNTTLIKPDAVTRTALAPTGTLRVGVYPGSPTSLVRNPKTGDAAGVALKLGEALGQRLGTPVQVVEFNRLALVLDALKAGTLDFTFTNATEARARDMDFTAPLIQLELGYLVPPASRISQVAEVDRAGVRVGVSQGSSSQTALARDFKSASLHPAASLQQAQAILRQGQIDAFATNKGILFEMASELPDYRVQDGRWGLENLAIVVPQGRSAAASYLRQFAQEVRASGLLQSIITRTGLRGTAQAN